MKKFFPLLFFLGITIIFFYKFVFLGKLPIPSDTIVGLYHPYRDLYASDYPNGIAYKNFLITDPVRQQYPWRHLAIDTIKNGNLPVWNPYNFSGTPLLANFQSAVFYPLNILLFILPFSYGWSILVFLQPLLAGIFMYYYLRYFSLKTEAAVLGGITFAFCGFSVAWMEWNTVIQTALWLPLFLLAKEHLLRRQTWQWLGVLIFAEVSTCFAGHLQTYVYAIIFSNIYLFVRGYQLWKQSGQKEWKYFFKRFSPFLYSGVIVSSITFIQAYPTFQFIVLSARNIDQANWHKDGWFIPWQHLIQFIAPDFFGNPTTLNYWGVWNYGEMVGYIGIIPLIFALYAIFFRRDKKVWYTAVLIGVCLLFALPTPLAQLPFLLHIPFLSSAQPTRLLFLIDFGLAFLTALGLDYYLRSGKKISIPIGVVAIVIGGLWLFVLGFFPFVHEASQNLAIAKRNLYVPTLLFISSFLLIDPQFIKLRKKLFPSIIILMLLITAFDLFRFFDKFTPFTNQEYLFPQTKIISFLKNQSQPFRIMATDSRIFPPNFSTLYDIESVEGYDPLYLERYGELIIASERGKPDISPPFGFNRIITPHNYNSPIIDLLNVQYVVSLDEIPSQKLVKIFQEGQTKVYKNVATMPRAFFIEKVIPAKNKQEAIEVVFTGNLKNQAAVENVNFSAREFTKGTILSGVYTPNSVTFTTNTPKQAFLVLTDMYHPSWKASIDSVETTLYQTDYTFRGVIVPPGKHRVRFTVSLL